jgi:V8-like Glu-specific endopeptidase
MLLCLVLALAGCRNHRALQPQAATRSIGARPEQSMQAPISLLTEEDAVVRVDLADIYCSGTLIRDDLVLTAHHCLVQYAGDEPLPYDVAPEAVHVELGGGHWPWGRVGVRAIVAPPCGYRTGHGDIAILVLSRKLVGMPTMRVRLDGPARVGETIEVIGYGRCSGSEPGVARVHRFGGTILEIGPGAFWAETAMCGGDSGGPALNPATGEIVGVASAAAMDDDDRSTDPAFFTRLGIWSSLFVAAQAVADGEQLSKFQPILGCAMH